MLCRPCESKRVFEHDWYHEHIMSHVSNFRKMDLYKESLQLRREYQRRYLLRFCLKHRKRETNLSLWIEEALKSEVERLNSDIKIEDLWHLHGNKTLSALALESYIVNKFYRDLTPYPKDVMENKWSRSLSDLGLECSSVDKFYRELIPSPGNIDDEWEKRALE